MKESNPKLFDTDQQHVASTVTTEITLRDLFAALALAGAISHGDTGSFESEAEEAYGYADAMLAERSK